MSFNEDHLRLAVALARENAIAHGGRPFGAVLVKDGEVLATGVNRIHETHDPSAHAELLAIRAAAAALKSPRLDGCEVYASGQPCPMCLSLMHMTGIRAAYFAASNEDGESYGLSTARIYAEMAKPIAQQAVRMQYVPIADGQESPFEAWRRVSEAGKG